MTPVRDPNAEPAQADNAGGWEVGNDGLTDAERAEYARRWRESAGRKPSAEEMRRYRQTAAAVRAAKDARKKPIEETA